MICNFLQLYEITGHCVACYPACVSFWICVMYLFSSLFFLFAGEGERRSTVILLYIRDCFPTATLSRASLCLTRFLAPVRRSDATKEKWGGRASSHNPAINLIRRRERRTTNTQQKKHLFSHGPQANERVLQSANHIRALHTRKRRMEERREEQELHCNVDQSAGATVSVKN